MKTSSSTRILYGLFVGFVFVSLFIPTTQLQAVFGGPCDKSSDCGGSTCNGSKDSPATPTFEGICTGPCDFDTVGACDVLKASLGWEGTKCTGTIDNVATTVDESIGVCLELPRGGSRLSDTAPATTGASLLTLVDTVTNWVFAIFTVLAIIFVLLAAFQFVTAGGEATKVEEARQKLIWAVVGIIIALLAKGIVPVLRGIIGG